jgi:uncharacterized HAD superfamily protein
MRFVNYRQLLQDVRAWSAQLPQDIVAVAGIPRSGLLPALHLSLHRNCHLVQLSDILADHTPWAAPLRRGQIAASGSRLLILDDSLNRGDTIMGVKSALRGMDLGVKVEFGALYYRAPVRKLVDYTFRHVRAPRCFEWNVFHCAHMRKACLDLDGVLCDDPDFREEDSEPGLHRWIAHLTSAAPRNIPSFPVMAVVTSRLEKYRRHTEEWLHEHGVRYGQLVMSPHSTAAARRKARDHAARKAQFYSSKKRARLFVESSLRQARQIAELTRKPVLCTDTMEMVHV